MMRRRRIAETRHTMSEGKDFVQAAIGGRADCAHTWREKIRVIRRGAEPGSESGWRCLACDGVEAWANVRYE